MIDSEPPSLIADPPVVLRRSPLMAALQDQGPICRVRTSTGDEAWLVTRYAEVKRLVNDERLGRSHADPPNAARYFENPLIDMLILSDDAETARDLRKQMRQLLTPNFSARRILRLRPMVEEHARNLLDDFMAKGQPGELHGGFAFPLSTSVLCDLMGVPTEDRDRFTNILMRTGQLDARHTAEMARQALFGYLSELVSLKRATPGDDVISRLCEAGVPTEYIGPLAAGLMFAGLDSVVSFIDLGVLLFITNPDQHEAVRRDPDLLPNAVEEILRAGKTSGTILPRYANADVEVGDVTIRTGDLVLLDFAMANADHRQFDEPERFDVTRTPIPHMALGHGIWHCIGAPLARIELQSAFAVLLSRMPNMRLAVAQEELRLKVGRQVISGLVELPLYW